jgi:hypothetical protein
MGGFFMQLFTKANVFLSICPLPLIFVKINADENINYIVENTFENHKLSSLN